MSSATSYNPLSSSPPKLGFNLKIPHAEKQKHAVAQENSPSDKTTQHTLAQTVHPFSQILIPHTLTQIWNSSTDFLCKHDQLLALFLMGLPPAPSLPRFFSVVRKPSDFEADVLIQGIWHEVESLVFL